MSFDEQTHFGHLDERGQFTGADGILEATRAIPNGQRMRIHLWRENDMETGYGPEFVYRAFTIATNKRRYDFDFVVPRTRRMTLGVQDPDGAAEAITHEDVARFLASPHARTHVDAMTSEVPPGASHHNHYS